MHSMHLSSKCGIFGGVILMNGLLAWFLVGDVSSEIRRQNIVSVPANMSQYFGSSSVSIEKDMQFSSDLRGYLNNTTASAPLYTQAAGINFRRTSHNRSCSWRVQFWDYQYRPKLRENSYYCPETGCTVHYTFRSSYDLMRTSDVVILHHLGDWDIDRIERVRRPDQILVYFTRECPFLTMKLGSPNFFNWTMTYSARSEIPIPYGTLIRNSPGKKVEQQRQKNWAEGKTGLAIWIVSNSADTKWPRLKYGKALGKFMNIDIFGRCGKPCGNKEECYGRIPSYKFYIAFENSQCQDYITEKMWRNAFMHDAVPIVYGAPKSDYERRAPPNSFIHISDFINMSSLAAYIHLLDRNDTLYNTFFEWKLDYHVEHLTVPETINEGTICLISRRLVQLNGSHDDNSFKSAEWYRNSCVETPRPKIV